MKELILITAHCPDQKRKDQLSNLINSLQPFRKEYDICISSHTHIPLEITEKVDYTIFDKENLILTDLDYLSSSWGIPFEDYTIYNTFVGKGTYILAIFRLMILGNGLAKAIGYQKIHQLEYDAVINDISCLKDNSLLLEEYDYVYYTHSGESNDFLLGFSMSYKIDNIIPIHKTWNQDQLLNFLKQRHAPEIIARNLILQTKFKCKKLSEINSPPNQLGLSGLEHSPNWYVPYYDPTTDNLCFIAWNNYHENGREVALITNKTDYLYLGNIPQYIWKLTVLGPINTIKNLQIILNNQIEFDIEFTPEYLKKFKETNYVVKKTIRGF
jgi:hypothetical protein